MTKVKILQKEYARSCRVERLWPTFPTLNLGETKQTDNLLILVLVRIKHKLLF